MKTRAEVDELKAQWLADPVWDLEETPGFEAHRQELLAWRAREEAEMECRHRERLEHKAEWMGVPGNLKLAEYIERLEHRLAILERRGK
jgi:hypothetical protein